MSSTRLEQLSYKLFEPQYHNQRPIIVDEELQSPDTVTLAYEEEAAARTNGGGLSVSMSAYKSQQPQVHAFAESPYSQFSPQSFASQPTDHATPQQINNIAFASNNAAHAAAYGPSSPSDSGAAGDVTVLSRHPDSGPVGTRVTLSVSSPTDLTASTSYVCVSFGSQRCPAQVCKKVENNGGWVFTISAVAPQFLLTQCNSPSDVPLTIFIDANADSMTRVVSGGSFTYLLEGGSHGHSGQLAGSHGSTGDLGQRHEDTTLKGEGQAHVDPQGNATPPPSSQGQHIQQHNQQQQASHLTVRSSGISNPSEQNQHDQHQQQQQTHDEQQLQHDALVSESTTNTFGYSAAGVAAPEAQPVPSQVQHLQNDLAAAAAGYNQQGGNDMLSSYRTRSSYLDHSYRPSSSLRQSAGSTWAPAYGSQDGTERYDYGRDTTNALARPAMMTASPRISQHGQHARMSSGLVRTSHLSASAQQLGMGYSGSWGVQKAQLHIRGGTAALDSMMTDRWTSEEWTNQRRIVLFTKRHNGPNLHIDFRPVSVSERPSNSICISCIYWARGPNERGECYVTSVDTIYLLERLIEPLATMGKFGVEEKNRIRRNLEGFKPITVSKGKPESEEFFKLIMGFPNPKPRNIEKDVKVFPWKVLGPALKKIVSKYSFDATGTSCSPAIPPPQSAPVSHLLTPVSLPAVSYSGLSTTPISATTATDPSLASGYVSMATHIDNGLPSPRSLPGSSSWSTSTATYVPPSSRTLSPPMKTHSPQQSSSGLRISTLPGVYDTRAGLVSAPAYGLSSHHQTHSPSHHHHSATGAGTSGRWDPYDSVPTSGAYSVPVPTSTYPSLAHHAHSHGTHGGVYGAPAYAGDAGQRH
ncbi:hypothetical protein PspLS_10739 [Pyricularia sp. CBS 133598]|nr:hypothetical protein PspLS_10739 [Pyricularia sp. CBS 133598]